VRNLDLLLPLDDGDAGEVARRRVDHLRSVQGIDDASLVRLGRSFPSLASVYSASEAKLATVVGPVAAARIRWFLDAPLDTRLVSAPAGAPTRSVRAA
jgi:ERCC4-type nuclease